ncbi:MAG TPA: hypothetical protein DCY59_03470, partial [Micrococcaceae bacterium]|nr:hypothetical protein [Micrococcaceae bacterium]
MSVEVEESAPEHPPAGTLTLARGLDILRAVGKGATTLNEVAASANIGKSAAQRMVKLLVQRGFLRSSHGTDFSLGPALIELGFHALYQSPVPVIAKPILEELARKYQDTVHLAVEDEAQ